MSFGRIRNKTLPTHMVELDSEKDTESRFTLDVIETKNLRHFAKTGLDMVKSRTALEGVKEVKGLVDSVNQGIKTGWEVGSKFWLQAVQDLNKITPVNSNVMSEFHFNMLKRGMTDDEKAYYKFLQASDEQLQGSYDEYVEKAKEEAQINRNEFVKAMDEKITAKKEEISASDDRAQELMEEYGVSAMLGYGFGQMLGNPNEAVTNVATALVGAKFATGTSIVGFDDLLNLTENILSNSISESIIAEAKGEEFSYEEVGLRTAGTFLFFKGLGELYKKKNLTVTEAKRVARAENIMAEDVVTARVTEDAIERGLVNDELDGAFHIEYPSEKAMDFTEAVGRDKYKAYVLKKTAEEFAYDEATGKGLTNENRLKLTKSRKEAEQELIDLIEKKYGEGYSFDEYIKDMDYAYKHSTVNQVGLEEGMKIEKGFEIDNQEIARHVEEAEFLETQDISMINTVSAELDDAKEILGKDDIQIKDWFDNNC